jgi:hypothetical protein
MSIFLPRRFAAISEYARIILNNAKLKMIDNKEIISMMTRAGSCSSTPLKRK